MNRDQVRLDGRVLWQCDGRRGEASTGDDEADQLLWQAQGDVKQAIEWAREFDQHEQVAVLQKLQGRVSQGEQGYLYRVQVPEDKDLLVYDKPLR